MPNLRPEPVTVFYSYSHKDEDLRNELETHLAALRRSGLIREWHDRKILAGQEWEKQISEYLDSAQLILFLLSADFVSSSYCVDIEVKRALERQSAGEAVVVPVILRPVVWGIVPQFNRLQALPKDARPVTEWPSHDLAFVSVCEGILALVTLGRTNARRTLPGSRSRRRSLDAALPARVPVTKPSTLLVMIRRTDSPGLASIVEADPDYQATEKDINTKPLTLKFPVDKDGKSQPLDLLVKIESPEFEPKSQVKKIKVPPRGDSEPLLFLLTPTRLGPLLVNLEVSLQDGIIAGCLLRTYGETPRPNEVLNPQNVVSAPLSLSASDDECGYEDYAEVNGDGTLAGPTGSASDVSDEKLAPELAGRLINASEAERSRIARELHDDICQRLALLSLELEQVTLGENVLTAADNARIADIRKGCARIAGDVQKLSHELHNSKLQDLGIAAALRDFCREFSEHQNVSVDFTHEDVPSFLPTDVSLCFFRVVQEALHNAAKYSGATRFSVDLRGTADGIQLVVSDDGAGFDVETAKRSGGLGLFSMQERVHLLSGIFSIESAPGRGTRIVASVPSLQRRPDR